MGDSEAGSVTLPPASPQQWLTRLRAHCGNDDFAATVAEMWAQGVEMDSQFTLRRGVQICLTANHPDLAIDFIKRARERRGVAPSAACVTSVLSALSKTEDLQRLLDFETVMHECARFTPHIYGAFMDAFAALGATEHVRRIEHSASSDYPLTGKLLCSALRAWGVLQSQKDFDRHWSTLEKSDFDGSHDVLTAAALGLSALHRWAALNEASIQWNTKWGAQPDWCSVLYLANLRAGDDEGANKALTVMNDAGFVFDMDACGRFFEVHRGVEEIQSVIQRAKGETTESNTESTSLPESTMLNICRTAALALSRTQNEAAARELVSWICRNAIVGTEAAQLLTAEFREDKNKESYTISPSTSSSSSPLASTVGRLSPFATPDPSPSVPTGLQRPARLQIPNPQPEAPQRRRSVAQTVTHVAITPPPQFGDTAAYALSPPASAALRRPLSAGVATEKPQVVPHPAEITISALIQSYGAEGRVKDVERCVHMLRVQGIEPTCATYNAVLGAYSQAHDWTRMAEWENEMREQGINPDLPTLQTLLVGFINAQMWQDAIRVQNEIIERGDMWGPEALQALLLLRHGNAKSAEGLGASTTNTNVITSADPDQLASALAAALTVSTSGGPPSAASHSTSGKDSNLETDVISPTTGPSSAMSAAAAVLDSEIPTSSSSAATSRLLLWPVNSSTPPASTPSAGGTPKPSVQNSPVPEAPAPTNGVHSKTAQASRRGGYGQWPESAASMTGSTPGISTASTTSWAGSHEPFPSASASIWASTSAGTAIPAFSPFPSTPSPAAGGPTPHAQYTMTPPHKGTRTPQPHPQATHLHIHTTHLHPHSPHSHGNHGGHTHGGHPPPPHGHNTHAPPHTHGSHLRPYSNAATSPPPPPPTSQPPSHTHGRSGVPHAQTLGNLSHYAQHNISPDYHHPPPPHSGQTNSHLHGRNHTGGIPQSHTHPAHGLGLQAFLPTPPLPSAGSGVYTDTISEYHNKIKSVLRRNTPSAWLEARQLWHELEFTHKMTPLEATYNVLLGGAPNEAAVTEVITGMQGAGVEWNRLLVGAALKALLRFGKLQRADQVVDHARTTGVALDVRVFNQMIDAYGKAQRLDDVQRYVHMLHELGLQPSVVTFGTLIKIYGSAGLIAEVDRCIAQMEALHIHPNSVAVTAMLTAFCKSGQLAKIEWALQLAGRDSIVIPERLWSTVLSAYIAQDMADRAFIVRQWCLWGQ